MDEILTALACQCAKAKALQANAVHSATALEPLADDDSNAFQSVNIAIGAYREIERQYGLIRATFTQLIDKLEMLELHSQEEENG